MSANQIRIDNLKKVIKESGVSQNKFSDECEISRTQISNIINGKTPLVEKMAIRICKQAKQNFSMNIRYQWLMGYDAFKTDFQYAVENIDKKIFADFYKGFKAVIESSGYTVKVSAKDENGIYKELFDSDYRDAFSGLLSAPKAEIFSGENKTPLLLTFAEYDSLAREIADYAAFKVNKLFEKYN